MRICLVTHRYPPRNGGVETHVHELATRLTARGHEVTVVTGDARSGMRERESNDGVEVIRHRGVAPKGAFHVAPGVAATVARLDADVVHAHNYHSFPFLFGGAAALASDTPLVCTPHYHGESASALRNALLSAYRLPAARVLRCADHVLSVSERERDLLRERFGVASTVVPNGLDHDRFRDAVPRKHGRPFLFCIGRLVEYKGVQHVIRALAHLDDYDLLVAGTGPYSNEAAAIAHEAGVEDRVSFLGYVPDEEVPGLYAGSDAHVQLSTIEAYGMTVAEALASGTPCVLRRASALADWCTRSDCVCVDDASPETVAAAVREAVERETSNEGIWSWQEVVDAVEVRYESLER